MYFFFLNVFWSEHRGKCLIVDMLLSGYHLQGFLYIFHDWPTDEPPKGRLLWKFNTKRHNIIILDRDPSETHT